MTDQTESNNKLAKIDFGSFNFGGAVSVAPTQIATTTGELVDIPDGVDIMDFIQPGGSGKPLGRIAIGQPSDDLYPREFYYSETVKVVDETTGEVKKDRAVKPLGKEVIVYPLGFVSPFNRQMMPKPFKPENKPLCRSENGITPDLRYAGRLDGKNVQCAVLDMKTKQLRTVCPFADWNNYRDSDDKKPPCSEQYVVFVALSYKSDESAEPEMLIAEMYFKSASAQEGRFLVATLRQLQRQQVPLYEMPIKLIGVKEGQGMTYKPIYKTANLTHVDASDVPAFEAAIQRVNEALQFRADRARDPRDNEITNGEHPDAATLSVTGGRPAPAFVKNAVAAAVAASDKGDKEPIF